MYSVLVNGRQARQRIQKLIENYDKNIHDEMMDSNCSSKYFDPKQQTKTMKKLFKCSLQIDQLLKKIYSVEKNSTWLDEIFSLNKQTIDLIEILESFGLSSNDNNDVLMINFRNQMLEKLQKHRQEMIHSFVKFLKLIIEKKLEKDRMTDKMADMVNNVTGYLNNVLEKNIQPNLEYIVNIWNRMFDDDDKKDEQIMDTNNHQTNHSNIEDSKTSGLSDCYISSFFDDDDFSSIFNDYYDDYYDDYEQEFSQEFSFSHIDDFAEYF